MMKYTKYLHSITYILYSPMNMSCLRHHKYIFVKLFRCEISSLITYSDPNNRFIYFYFFEFILEFISKYLPNPHIYTLNCKINLI